MIRRNFRFTFIIKLCSKQTVKRLRCGLCTIIVLLILRRLYHLSEVRDIVQRSKYYQQIAANEAYYRNFKCVLESTENETNFDRKEPWLAVEDREFVAATAYVDAVHDSNYVRIFGLRSMLDVRPYLCVFYSSKDFKTWEIQTKIGFADLVNEMQECLWLRFCAYNPYDAFYVSCPVKYGHENSKYNFVSLRPTERPVNNCWDVMKLPKLKLNEIHYDQANFLPKHNFSICVSPTFEWNNVLMLKMFLEHYTSQGFTKFMIYKRSWSKKIDDILKRYSRFVEIVDWPIFPNVSYANLNVQVNVHYHAQILSMNDCLWRLKGRTKFVAFVDFDEFITPVNHWQTIAEIILNADEPGVGGFYLQNRYFLFNFRDLNPQTEILFDEKIFPAPSRSKMIVKPDAVQKQGIHNVWQYLKGFRDKIISSDSALMYHWKKANYEVLSGRFLSGKFQFKNIFPLISVRKVITKEEF